MQLRSGKQTKEEVGVAWRYIEIMRICRHANWYMEYLSDNAKLDCTEYDKHGAEYELWRCMRFMKMNTSCIFNDEYGEYYNLTPYLQSNVRKQVIKTMKILSTTVQQVKIDDVFMLINEACYVHRYMAKYLPKYYNSNTETYTMFVAAAAKRHIDVNEEDDEDEYEDEEDEYEDEDEDNEYENENNEEDEVE